jgi:hypothetical protein
MSMLHKRLIIVNVLILTNDDNRLKWWMPIKTARRFVSGRHASTE